MQHTGALSYHIGLSTSSSVVQSKQTTDTLVSFPALDSGTKYEVEIKVEDLSGLVQVEGSKSYMWTRE